jgi:hypothetical protein
MENVMSNRRGLISKTSLSSAIYEATIFYVLFANRSRGRWQHWTTLTVSRFNVSGLKSLPERIYGADHLCLALHAFAEYAYQRHNLLAPEFEILAITKNELLPRVS